MTFILAIVALGIVTPVLAEDLATEPMLEGTTQEQTQKPEDAIEIEGDKLDLYLDRKMRASGNATIRKGDQSISGDNIEYDTLNDELHVEGNAKIELGGSRITGPELRMRLSESIGEMRDASIVLNNKTKTPIDNDAFADSASTSKENIQQPNFYSSSDSTLDDNMDVKRELEGARGDAAQILFEGQDKKHLKHARFTTCEADVNDWYIKAQDLTLDDYTKSGEARNAYIEFKGVPLIYTPWMSFSFNNQRKSGLLAPTVGTTSRSGFEVLAPFYWNIRPDMDATLSTRYLSKRGVQLGGEFRYLDESYSGTDSIEYLNNDDQNGRNRYYYNLSHRHNFGGGWTAGYNIERVSDDQYFSDLSTRIISTSRVNLPQDGFVDFQNDTWHFRGLVQKYQTLDNASYTYERLPELTLTANKEYGDYNLNLLSQWTYFDRNESAPKAATGSRFVAYPSISMPFTRSYGFLTPKLGVHASSYRLNNNTFIVNSQTISNNSQDRVLPVVSLDGGLYLDAENNFLGTNYTQTFEPRLFYVYTPYENQSLLPVFDSGLSDLNLTTLFTENQFTGQDRINNANQISLGLTTRLIDRDTGIERIAATIGERFYFDDQKVTLPNQTASNRKTSDIVAGFTARLSSQWNVDAFWQYNPDASSIERTNLLARYNPEPGKLINMGYRYTEDFLEQIDISGQWPLGKGWYGVGRYNYSIRESNLIESLAGVEYDAGCWRARSVLQRLKTATANTNYALFFQLELGGLASLGSNPLSLLRRDIAGYQSSGEIPNFYRQQNYAQ
ncbi:MAG TPA: LPS-assembly protein LptD [Methylophilaceae bacterium]|nr:LPS-assembly protein LptD [Methylophilaceae bacterium]HAJ72390.1 LPS-assembly protein LptD [Methylophilaceae bacterium]